MTGRTIVVPPFSAFTAATLALATGPSPGATDDRRTFAELPSTAPPQDDDARFTLCASFPLAVFLPPSAAAALALNSSISFDAGSDPVLCRVSRRGCCLPTLVLVPLPCAGASCLPRMLTWLSPPAPPPPSGRLFSSFVVEARCGGSAPPRILPPRPSDALMSAAKLGRSCAVLG